jgi:signal transduction histidine kinase
VLTHLGGLSMKLFKPICGWGKLRCVFLLAFGLASAVSPACAAESPRRIFLLEGLTAAEESVQRTAQAFKQRLNERSPNEIDVYSEFLDLQRFSGPENENRLSRFLGAKFAQVKPDVVVPISLAAVDFMVRHRGDFAHDIPIVYCCTPTSVMDTLDIPPDIPGVVMEFDWAGTLSLAERLQPNAKRLVIISGAASDIGRRRDQELLGALQPLLQKYDTKFLTALPYDELLKQVSQLPRDSIVLMTRVFEDGSGRARGPEVAEDVSKASAAPVYSASPTYMGLGVVGGHLDSFRSQGAKAADLALDILSGKAPSTLPHQTRLPLQYRVDARQLKRWGFAEASLPPGTSVDFQQPTLWGQYHDTIVLVLLAFAAMAGIITLLLIEIRKRQEAEERRKAAEAEADLRRNELTHMMRVAALGELSGGIAHELSQPLAAILANAQAAQAMLAGNSHDKEEIAEILEEIVQEDNRAGKVIQGLRQLLRKGENRSALIRLNDLTNSTLGLLNYEIVTRKMKVETELKTDLPPIAGDSVQLQQVLLNLMMNAMEAMASTPASKRTINIATRTTEDGYVEVSIRDHGPGMSPDELNRLFEPFFTTKERGLGLGLSICATIVRSHRGRLNLSNARGGGVTAIVSMPLSVQLAAVS